MPYDKRGDKNPFYGRTHSDDAKRRMSDTRTSKGLSAGDNNPTFGKPRSEEVKKVLRHANLGKTYSDKVNAKKASPGKTNGSWSGYWCIGDSVFTTCKEAAASIGITRRAAGRRFENPSFTDYYRVPVKACPLNSKV